MDNQLTIHEIPLPNRALRALERTDKFRTLGQLAKAKDDDLLAIPRLGRKALTEIRETIAKMKAAEINGLPNPVRDITDEPHIAWAREHKNLVRAIMAKEVVITYKTS